jgi:hypothetical protein
VEISLDCDNDDFVWIIAKPLAQRLRQSVWGIDRSNDNSDIFGFVLRISREG